jgi:hypothetical protein
MSRVDRERIADLLADETLSYRAIARMTGASDWSVRRIQRELAHGDRPMGQQYAGRDDESAEVSRALSWAVFGGSIGLLGLMIWAAVRFSPPPEF